MTGHRGRSPDINLFNRAAFTIEIYDRTNWGAMDEPLLVDVPTTCMLLGVCRSTLKHWRRNGIGPQPVDISSTLAARRPTWRYRLADVREWVAKA